MSNYGGPPLTAGHHRLLHRMYIEDRRLDRRPPAPELTDAFPGLVRALRAHRPPLVYTAFDGDHFELAAQMRSYVLRHGGLPANPESIVGYHDSVQHHGARKDEVLADDLAILKGCQRLWVFTDVEASAAGATRHLAEGVLVELLFFLARQELPVRGGKLKAAGEVLFVPVANLFGAELPPVRYRDGYHRTRELLQPDQEGIGRLIDRIGVDVPALPPVAYIAHDPLDAKYVHWLRPYAYGKHVVPLVPTLALELSDTQLVWPGDALAQAAIARLGLLRLADELWILPAQQRRPESYTVQLLQRLWPGDHARPADKVWNEMDIPKATSKDWHVTRKEAVTQYA